MAANRWAIHLLIAAGLPTLPACLVGTGPGSLARSEQPPPATSVTTLTRPQFAELPRAPGEHVPLHNLPAEPTTSVLLHQPAVDVGMVNPPAPAPLPETVTAPHPPPADPPLVAVLRAFMDGRPDLAREPLESLDGPNQELVLQLVPALVRASQVNLTRPSTEIGDLARQLEAPAAAVAARAPLAIEKACFCRWVKNFARYEALPEPYIFRPASWAALYVEMRNVPSVPASSPSDGDGYLTRLVCTLQVRDATGAVIPMPDESRKPVPALRDDTRDFTRSPIRDYFLLFRFPVPAKPGAYTVTVEIQDPASERPGSGRAVSRVMSFRVQ
jgi:hypothetical protein